ncbi:TMEM165/GDT1 family protein [Alkaliphilus peptidifermentans]|uniref:GDT1 family protein n=1 Tax=Alkaliphilus peptidifermentans DSM 18978 TaxID=1120976 RepID=A0A1G5KNP7_9FIRM|nr:TMEM165/GDT1 family protein [Alkaliphilus peptidifermentans]SCZ02217.1 Putative Ca2+/H+ antiporter, TMEM165/GDT1 family [Alkaliphilus peptidifermentans DSM 18978]
MILELINAFGFIFLAEMGDKTQILAMAFASKYSYRKVLLGVFLGSLLNHGLAIVLGTYLTHLIPFETIRFISAMAFTVFGIWSLKLDNEEDDLDKSRSKYGPVMTVATAFFIGELGDKTQLTAITLATRASYPLVVLIGTVMGMIVTSAMGVWVGSKLGKRIPEATVKVISSCVFIVFGLMGLKEFTPHYLMQNNIIAAFLVTLAVIILFMLSKIINSSNLQNTSIKRAADKLYLNTHKIQSSLVGICLCDKGNISCIDNSCTIGRLNELLKEAQEKEEFIIDEEWNIPLCNKKAINYNSLKESLLITIDTCIECPSHSDNCVGNQTRKTLETLYFGKSIDYKGDRQVYINDIKKLDPNFFKTH